MMAEEKTGEFGEKHKVDEKRIQRTDMDFDGIMNRGGTIVKEKEEKVGRNKQAFLFCSLRLSQVQAGIFILPGENANHQSQAACYVSV